MRMEEQSVNRRKYQRNKIAGIRKTYTQIEQSNGTYSTRMYKQTSTSKQFFCTIAAFGNPKQSLSRKLNLQNGLAIVQACIRRTHANICPLSHIRSQAQSCYIMYLEFINQSNLTLVQSSESAWQRKQCPWADNWDTYQTPTWLSRSFSIQHPFLMKVPSICSSCHDMLYTALSLNMYANCLQAVNCWIRIIMLSLTGCECTPALYCHIPSLPAAAVLKDAKWRPNIWPYILAMTAAPAHREHRGNGNTFPRSQKRLHAVNAIRKGGVLFLRCVKLKCVGLWTHILHNSIHCIQMVLCADGGGLTVLFETEHGMTLGVQIKGSVSARQMSTGEF